jgi:ribose transport system ATP-binding protein
MPGKAGTPALSISSLSKTFAGTRALDDVSVTLRHGEVHALVGANGSGKSTLIKVVAGVARGDGGGVIRAGRMTAPSDRTTPEWAREAGLRFVHQDLALFLDLSIAENVAIASRFETTRFAKIDWLAQRTRTGRLLDRFQIDARPETVVSTLDPADRAMVAIARALEDEADGEPRVLILDEPTAALPERDSVRLLSSLRHVADRGQAVLVVSHRIGELLTVADTTTVLRDGRVAGTLARPALSESRVLEFMARPVHDRTGAGTRASADNGNTLEVDELVGGPIRGISFAVRGGEILGIAGMPGSGRSELLQMLFGAKPIRSGDVRIGGSSVRLRDIGDAIRAGIAYVPEERGDSTFGSLSLFENLSAATVSSYWRRWRLDVRSEELDAYASMQRFSIRASTPGQPMWTLSGGNQQKVILARWLRCRPRVLLLDEPTRGVDANARSDITVAVREVSASGAVVIVVSSDLDDLCAVADRVIVLVNGRVACEKVRPPLEPRQIAQLAYASGPTE